MDHTLSSKKRWLALPGTLLLAACAGFGGSDLKPGTSTRSDVVASMGTPAMAWKNPDGSEQLAYPRGPEGTQTFMAWLGPDGRLQRIDKVLDGSQFHRVRPGMHKDEVLRVLGPPSAPQTQYFSMRNELAWSWLFCSSWNAQEYFDVMFDAATGIVRYTSRRPDLRGIDGIQPSCGQ